ncbi:hypothetical protein ACWEKJ_03545 [Amycolatopsis thermoflava]
MSRWWHGLIALVVIASLAVPLTLIFTGGADANSARPGKPQPWRPPVAALQLLHRRERHGRARRCSGAGVAPTLDGPVWRVAQLGALLGILITGLVFAIVLARQVHLTRSRPVRDHRLPLHLPTGDDRGVAAVRAARADLVVDSRGRLRVPLTSLVYIFTQGAFTRSWT